MEYFTPYSWTSRTLGKGTCVHTTRNRAMMIGHWHYHKCKPIPRAGLVRDWNQTSDKSRPQGCPGARQTGLDLVCSNKRLTPPPPLPDPPQFSVEGYEWDWLMHYTFVSWLQLLSHAKWCDKLARVRWSLKRRLSWTSQPRDEFKS